MIKRLILPLLLAVAIPAQSVIAAEVGRDSVSTMRRVAPYAVRIGSSLIINAALTEVLKSSIHEMRPNRDDNGSWPSRHVSWTATVASIISHELHCKSPWWVLGAHAIVDGVAMQRTFSQNHFPKDVLGGMAVGIASTELGYLIGRLIYPKSQVNECTAAAADFLAGLDVTTTAFFPLSGCAPGVTGRTGISTSVRGQLPFSNHFGAMVAINLKSMPLYTGDVYTSTVDGAGIAIGAVGYIDLPSPRWNCEGRASVGFLRNFHGAGVSHPKVSATFDLTIGTSYTITERLSMGCEAGYSLWTLKDAVSSISVGFFTRAAF